MTKRQRGKQEQSWTARDEVSLDQVLGKKMENGINFCGFMLRLEGLMIE